VEQTAKRNGYVSVFILLIQWKNKSYDSVNKINNCCIIIWLLDLIQFRWKIIYRNLFFSSELKNSWIYWINKCDYLSRLIWQN
jgi:hypothetical protein